MAAKYLRRCTWWVRFYDPRTGELRRGSLETRDPARAELLRPRIELEAALLDPRFQAVGLPAGFVPPLQGAERARIAVEQGAPIIVDAAPEPRPVS